MSALPHADRRRHHRLPAVLKGRCMLPDRSEHRCHSVDISPGGILLHCDARPFRGQRIIAYLAEIGRIEGLVTRIVKDGFAMSITGTGRKREKLSSTITWVANRDALDLPESRSAERIVPDSEIATIVLPGGMPVNARILDVSMTGIALSLNVALPRDAPVLVGGRTSRIVRSDDCGVGLAFDAPLTADELTPGIRFD